MQYTVPELDALSTREIETLEITQPGGVVTLTRSGENWRIEPEGYRVDPAVIVRMLDSAADLQLTELVSVTGNYSRYGLDEPSRIRVTVFKKDKMLRRFDLGTRSPSYNHTFIRIDGDDRVFQTPGNPRESFGLTKEDLRDRVVLLFDPVAITDISARGAGWTVHLAKMGITWTTKTGELWEAETISELLNTLSDLKAFHYTEQDQSDGGPVFSITLTGSKPYTLEVFARQGNSYPAHSSENDSPFVLYYAVTENIINVFTENR
jgi:hypothetical protein